MQYSNAIALLLLLGENGDSNSNAHVVSDTSSKRLLEEQDQLAKSAGRVTSGVVFLMQLYDSTHYHGCHILQTTCPWLTKDQRKKLGVVAAIGSVLVSSSKSSGGHINVENINSDRYKNDVIKSICDEILADI
jgi:hypothetical protein